MTQAALAINIYKTYNTLQSTHLKFQAILQLKILIFFYFQNWNGGRH